jgi:serine/threonine protein kinase/ABC-type branched-subunit amino acid transport system substrate-binding protein
LRNYKIVNPVRSAEESVMSSNTAAPPAAKPSLLGHRIGRYDLIAGIGHGGMADVFLAVLASGDASRFQKLLVLKLLKPEFSAEPEFVEMFLEEARLAARLNHPNVIQTIEVGADGERHFLAMEYVEGQPLNRVARALLLDRAFDLSAKLTIMLRALNGLDYAHELADYDRTPLGIVHRDVSPGNILVGYDGQIKLMDFGIAKAKDSSSHTRAGLLKGKIAYMPPEQARGGDVDRRADIFAAGVVLWELITGRRMWSGLSQGEIVTRVVAGNIPSPGQLAPGVPPEVEAICMKALAPKREDRYASAAELAAALESFVRRHLEPKSERDVGKLVAGAFSNDRARIREIIDQQLSPRARGTGNLPQIVNLTESGIQASVRAGNDVSAPSQTAGGTHPSSPLSSVSLAGGQAAGGSPLSPGAPAGARTIKLAAAAGAAMLAIGAGALLIGRHPAPATTAAPVAKAPPERATPPGSQPVQQGVSPTEIALGMSAVFSGPSRQLGENMKLGLETAFSLANSEGGIHGRKIHLVALDDGYEAARAATTMQELLDRRQVFAVVGNVGTPTSAVAAPIASKQKTIFFGAFTGAPVLRQDPPDRYVFNYRASYREETAESVKYLATVQKIPIDRIVVFAQEDSYGDAGYEGVIKAVRHLNREARDVLRVGYKRNTTDVEGAIAQIVKYHEKTEVIQKNKQGENVRVPKHPVKAVVMVSTYKAGAKFIQQLRAAVPNLKPLFFNVSFVGTEALADDLKALGSGLCEGVYVTQVVPPATSGATGVRRYRDALATFQPQAQPGFVSLEGFIVGSVLIEALKRTGRELTTERLIDTIEQFDRVDLGFGAPLSYSLSEHQGSHKVWGTRLDESCVPQPIDLD